MAAIVVVGGGLAGLTCAWRLRGAGHDVEVLEREPHPGGRVRSEPVGGFRVERGALFLTSGQANTLSVVEALGLGDAVRSLAGEGEGVPGAVLAGGRFEPTGIGSARGLWQSRALGSASKLRLAALGLDLHRNRKALDPLRPARAARLEDGESGAAFASRTAGAAARDQLLGPAVAALQGAGAEGWSGASLRLALRGLLEGVRPLSLEGGLGRLSEELADAVPVRCGCEVFSVETETGGARVAYQSDGREQTVVADAAVVALPAPAALLVCPKLTPDERGFLESVRYTPAITAHLLLDAAPPGLAAYALAFPENAGHELLAVYQSHRAPDAAPHGAGILSAALARPAAERLARADNGEIAAWVVDALERTPIGRLEPRAAVVDRWEHARPLQPVGFLSRLANFGARIDRSPRLAFAGDYLLAPTIEGAVTSGMRAASKVLAGLE